jgi:predicted DNA-binding ribbon-helix-helix protein
MKTAIIKHSIKVRGRTTSVRLEDPFWNAMKAIADLKGITVAELVTEIDANRKHANLSSAIRLFVLDHYRSLASARKQPLQKANAVTAGSPSR